MRLVPERKTVSPLRVTVTDGEQVYELRHNRCANTRWPCHSSEFNWGYGGSGPAELAKYILIDLLGRDAVLPARHIWPPVVSYQDFKQVFVARMGDEWELTETEIRTWLAMQAPINQ